jgi:cytidylate kinase
VFQIAIDGPSGAGKSTIAKALAKKLSLEYIDTGAMYRAVALKMIESGVALESIGQLAEMMTGFDVDFSEGRIMLDGRDISGFIRTERISKLASDCSAIPVVREKLVALQRLMGERKSVVMDGRDIGSNVFPNAQFKFYLTASAKVRAERRLAELLDRGENVSFEQILLDINERDHNDSHRLLNPLTKTDDAVEIDSTELSIEAVLDKILACLELF